MSKKFILVLPLLFFFFASPQSVSAITYTGNYPNGLVVKEDNAIVENADISNAGGSSVCLRITGDNVTVRNTKIHDCEDHGINFKGVNGGTLENSEIYRAAMRYKPNSISGGWPSLIKVQSDDESPTGLAQNIVIKNNYIHDGYGECMALRGSHITVSGNTVKDCYSIGIYSNSDHTIVENNFVQCTMNAEYLRDGLPMSGIGFAEESYAGWGAHGHDSQTVRNNIVTGCKYGIRYGSSTNNQGLSDTTISFNTLDNIKTMPISITSYSSQSNVVIENNIASKVSVSATGSRVAGNVAKTFSANNTPSDFVLTAPLPATANSSTSLDFFGRGRTNPIDVGAVEYDPSTTTPATSPSPTPLPNRTPTPTRTPTPSRTPTPARTPTPTQQPSPTTPARKLGDANFDNKVDGLDYINWSEHYRQTTTRGAIDSDHNMSNTIDGVDYMIWAKNYGK